MHLQVWHLLLVSLIVCPHASCQSVVIDSVEPRTGSIAGGTRLQIKGRGFSSNMVPNGNTVIIGGKFRCDVIPLHSTVSQIACKTRSAENGAFMTNWRPSYHSPHDDWSLPHGETGMLPVVVIVNGISKSTCSRGDSDPACMFEFTSRWYHTPKIFFVSPRAVREGQMVNLSTEVAQQPFSVANMRMPSNEVGIASIKVC